MSVAQLIDVILINPTVHLTPSGRDTGFTASYTFQPLSNLVYTRDQQVRGVRARAGGAGVGARGAGGVIASYTFQLGVHAQPAGVQGGG